MEPVRRAGKADLAGLLALASHVLPVGWDEPALAGELARHGSRVFVAGDRADVCAAAIARRAGDDVELLWIAVAPAARRRGLGAGLIAAVLRWARCEGARVVLEVRTSNAAARSLYGAAGFVVVGRRPRYYRDGEDALLLAREPSRPSAEASS